MAERPNTWLTSWLSRPVAVLSWAVALLLGGSWAALQVPLEWVPQVELPEVRITAAWPGAEPRMVERYVTAPIERAVQRVPGTETVESLSEEGVSSVILGVGEEVDLGPYVTQVNEQLTLLRDVLPERVFPRLTKKIPEALRDQQGFITLQLIGPLPLDALRSLAEDDVAPRLRSLNGVADVVVEGGTERELRVTLDPDRLEAYDVNADVVRLRLGQATVDATYGRFEEPGRTVLLLSPAEAHVDVLQRLVVRPPVAGSATPVRLADVAEVTLGPAPVRSISRIDGDPVVTLTIDRARGSHMVAVAEAVVTRIETLREGLPGGVRLLIADDRTEQVRAQLRDLTWRGGVGLALVILVLLFMLKSVRATAIVLFSVSVALAVALASMGPLGLTLNLLTLAGLVLVFGLLVDNAVVVVEQLILQRARLRHSGMKGVALEATCAAEALKAVWLPLVGGTLSTMAVMVPLVYLSGELRALFLPFGVLVSLTLGASLAGAALLVPVMGRYLPPPEPPRHARRWTRRIVAAPYRWAGRFPRLTFLLFVLVLGLPLWKVPRNITPVDDGPLPATRLAALYDEIFGSAPVQDARAWLDPALGGVLRPFFRQIDFGQRWNYNPRPTVFVSLRFPPGSPIERADSLMHVFEGTALASEAVSRTIVRVSERSASMQVQFTRPSLRTAEPYVVREQLIREAVLLGGIQVSVGGLLPEGYFSGTGGGVSGMMVEAYGPNYEDLELLCERFAERLKRRSRRVANVNTNAGRYGFRESREVLRFRWEAGAQARTGATAGMLAGVLRPIFSTRFPSLYADVEGETNLPVRVVVKAADRTDVARVMARPLPLGDSARVRLAGLADYAVEETPSGIERADQQYKRYVSIEYRGPYRMGNELVQHALDAMPLPPGYRLQLGRGFFFTEEVQQAFGWVLIGTLALIFLVVAAVFESWKLPWVVMLSVPMAAIGVAVGFLLTDAAFAEGAFIGTVLLLGIAVNDSILLVDRYRQLRTLRPGTASSLLARLAVRDRLRPMWTTTLTSVVAMLPLLVFPDDGEFWLGLAVTVTGGLLASTLLAPLASVALLTRWRVG